MGVARLVPRARPRRVPARVRLARRAAIGTPAPTAATTLPRVNVGAAVGRRISRRWALNSRFCRAMKMSRLINTSGSRSSLLPTYSLPPPFRSLSSLSPPPLPRPSPVPSDRSLPRERRKKDPFVRPWIMVNRVCFFVSFPLRWKVITAP